MEEVTIEMKELARSAATAYLTSQRINDVDDAMDIFLDAYECAIKKVMLREHKVRALRDFASDEMDNKH
jgi:hypothetical protein